MFKMFDKFWLLLDIEESLEKIRLVYKNASKKRKKYIKEWIGGITIDKDSGDDYYKVEFDGKNLVVFDEKTGEEIELKDIQELELWFLASELKYLLEELGGDEDV